MLLNPSPAPHPLTSEIESLSWVRGTRRQRLRNALHIYAFYAPEGLITDRTRLPGPLLGAVFSEAITAISSPSFQHWPSSQPNHHTSAPLHLGYRIPSTLEQYGRAMDVANLLSYDPPRSARPQQGPETTQPEPFRAHQYPTRHSVMSNTFSLNSQNFPSPQAAQPASTHNTSPSYSLSLVTPTPKNVAFELLFDGGSNSRARLPMRVQIFPHDTTDSIVTTVKNFYGLYEGAAKGISFEDDRGNILIARYENFLNNMTVYVRVIPDYSQAWQLHGQILNRSASPISAQRVHPLEEPLHMHPPQPSQALSYGQGTSRPASRVARKQSASPRLGRRRRSASAQKIRSRSDAMSREDSFQSHLNNLNSDNAKGYTSSDGEGASVTSSRKARSEQLASAEISLDNILEGNRRKRAKFESSVSLCKSYEYACCPCLTILSILGVTAVCSPSSARTKLNLLYLSSEAVKRSRPCLSLCETYTKSIGL